MKKLVCIVLAMLMVFGLVACSASGETASTSASAETSETALVSADVSTTASAEATEAVEFPEMTIEYSTWAAETDIVGQGVLKFKELVEAATGGKVKVEPYFASSLFTQDQELEACMKGNLDMYSSAFDGLVDYYPEFSTLTVPYMFTSNDHVKRFSLSDACQEIVDKVADELGLHCFMPVYSRGGRYILLNADKKITSRADLEGIKLRVSQSESWINIGNALGANAVALEYSSCYLALQTGTIDALENGPSGIRAMGFYEVGKSLTKTNHIYANGFPAMNEELWKSMSPELQQIIQSAAEESSNYTTELGEALEEEDMAFLEEQGLKIYELSDEEFNSYRNEVMDCFFANEDMSADVDMDLYQKIVDMAD